MVRNIPVWGKPLDNAVEQMENCLKTAAGGALMADHHLGYSVPVGGVVSYKNQISPSGVGFDIACGNKAIKLDTLADDIRDDLDKIMDDIFKTISFGVGLKNKERVDHIVFDNQGWDDIPFLSDELKELAMSQLGTVGSGNHYVDVFEGSDGHIWIGVHFGSRGLGHKIASHYIKEGGGTDGMFVDPVVLDLDSELGQEYYHCMNLAGEYAYAGRDWVCDRVRQIIGGAVIDSVHNHHNFAWLERHNGEDFVVVRKGATPCFPGQRGFVGGSMGEPSVILEGVDSDESRHSMYSTVHGAGRVMSRREAAGKTKFKKGKRVRVSEGKISKDMMMDWVNSQGVKLRGAGVDESPHCYKRLDEVLNHHRESAHVTDVLKPLGVCMAGEDIFDPYKD